MNPRSHAGVGTRVVAFVDDRECEEKRTFKTRASCYLRQSPENGKRDMIATANCVKMPLTSGNDPKNEETVKAQ